MASCARCGNNTEKSDTADDYAYCDECRDLFDSVKEQGVFVRSRHGNRAFNRYPFVVSPNVTSKWTDPSDQVEALAAAKETMEERGVRGVFHYQKTGSWWLIDEYLEAHPGIAADVEEKRSRRARGLQDLLPW